MVCAKTLRLHILKCIINFFCEQISKSTPKRRCSTIIYIATCGISFNVIICILSAIGEYKLAIVITFCYFYDLLLNRRKWFFQECLYTRPLLSHFIYIFLDLLCEFRLLHHQFVNWRSFV